MIQVKSHSVLRGRSDNHWNKTTRISISLPQNKMLMEDSLLQSIKEPSMGGVRSACQILVRKCEWKRPLGRCRCWWEDNIKVDST
jgi:hypothetical protein